jgi:signal peptidase
VTHGKPAAARSTTGTAVYAVRRIAAWVLGLLLFSGTAAALAVAVYPMVTSGSALAVLSGSMTPGLPVGGMVFTRPVDPADIVAEDVITFQRPSNPAELVTHRVVAVDTSSGAPIFTTKGDANPAPDLDPVSASAVQGELWFSAPQVGRLAAVLHSPQGLGVLIVLVCAVLGLSPDSRPTAKADAGPDDESTYPDDGLDTTARITQSDPDTVRMPAVRPPLGTVPRVGLL